MKIIMLEARSRDRARPGCGGVVSMTSITVPRAELYVCQSSEAACTSAKRLSA